MDTYVLVGNDTTTREDGYQKLITCNSLQEAKELAEVWMTQDVAENVGIYKLACEGTPPQKHVRWTEIADKSNGVCKKFRGPNEKTRRSGRRWTPTEDKALMQARNRGKGIAEIAIDMDRSEKAIAVRAARIGAKRKHG